MSDFSPSSFVIGQLAPMQGSHSLRLKSYSSLIKGVELGKGSVRSNNFASLSGRVTPVESGNKSARIQSAFTGIMLLRFSVSLNQNYEKIKDSLTYNCTVPTI